MQKPDNRTISYPFCIGLFIQFQVDKKNGAFNLVSGLDSHTAFRF